MIATNAMQCCTYNATNPTLLEWMGKNRDVVGYMLIELLGSLMSHFAIPV